MVHWVHVRTKYVHMCMYEGLGISITSLMDCYCMYACMNGKAWNCYSQCQDGMARDTPYYSGRIAIGVPVEDFSPL